MNNKIIGKYLKEQRVKNNYTQNELSEIIHVTRQAVSNWETGKAIPDSAILIRLSELYKVSIDEILIGKPSEENLQKLTLNLIDNNNKQRSKIKKLFTTLFLVIITFIVTFLLYYFITSYNATKIYLLSGKSNNYVINDGVLIRTNEKIYIRIGNINKTDFDRISLYYLNEKKKKTVIYNGDDINTLIIENYKYNDMYRKKLSNVKNNLYIEIQKGNKKEKLKIKARESFKSSAFFNNKRPIEKEKEKPEDKIIEKSIIVKNQPVIEVPIEEVNEEVKEPPKEEIIESPKEEKNDKYENIDYEKVINLIEEKGDYQFNGYILNFKVDNIPVYLYAIGKNIRIEVVENNTIETWGTCMSDYKIERVEYMKFDNGNELENRIIYLNNIEEKDKELLQKMNGFLEEFLKSNL